MQTGWVKDVSFSGKQYPLTANLQNMRDAIAQAIVDVLTNTQATSTISSGNTQGTSGIVRIDGNVNLNHGLPTQSVARIGDSVVISDPIFLAWIATVSVTLNSLATGSVPIVPTVVSGIITSGSSNVKVGG